MACASKTATATYAFSKLTSSSSTRGSITDANARYNRGFGSLGGYHAGSTTPSVGSQFWGDIANFMCYNRRLSDSELLQNYNIQKGRFGL